MALAPRVSTPRAHSRAGRSRTRRHYAGARVLLDGHHWQHVHVVVLGEPNDGIARRESAADDVDRHAEKARARRSVRSGNAGAHEVRSGERGEHRDLAVGRSDALCTSPIVSAGLGPDTRIGTRQRAWKLMLRAECRVATNTSPLAVSNAM